METIETRNILIVILFSLAIILGAYSGYQYFFKSEPQQEETQLVGEEMVEEAQLVDEETIIENLSPPPVINKQIFYKEDKKVIEALSPPPIKLLQQQTEAGKLLESLSQPK